MPVKNQKEEERKFIFSTKIIDEVTNKINDGVVIKRFQNPWFQSEIGLRKSGITFKMTEDEIQEYIKCKLDIHYFAEKYCKIKTEDGSVQNIRLRDYQKDILDLYSKNRFNLAACSLTAFQSSTSSFNATSNPAIMHTLPTLPPNRSPLPLKMQTFSRRKKTSELFRLLVAGRTTWIA
jgi:hypothetical protein